MKRRIVNFVNKLLRPLGISIYKEGYDMASALTRIKKHGFPISTIIDLGASDGKWSKSAMGILKDSKFLAIEPLEERKGLLEKLKEKDKNFDYELCAAGEKDKEIVKIVVTEDLDGSTISSKSGIGVEREITVRTLDSLILSKKLQGPYLIKFDTHGYEVPILKGAENVLKSTSIIIMEVYNYRLTENSLLFNEMIDYLKEFGFRCYDIADPLLRPLDKTFWQLDLFFARADNKVFEKNTYK